MQKNITIMILDAHPGEAAKEGAELARVAPDGVEISALGFDSADALADALKDTPADCLLLHLGNGSEDEQALLNRYARQSGGPATVVIADNIPLDRALEWVHRGIQDVIGSRLPTAEVVRSVMLALERRRLLNDAHQALRLEQENVHKMQKFVDELVGYATRTATLGR